MLRQAGGAEWPVGKAKAGLEDVQLCRTHRLRWAERVEARDGRVGRQSEELGGVKSKRKGHKRGREGGREGWVLAEV